MEGGAYGLCVRKGGFGGVSLRPSSTGRKWPGFYRATAAVSGGRRHRCTIPAPGRAPPFFPAPRCTTTHPDATVTGVPLHYGERLLPCGGPKASPLRGGQRRHLLHADDRLRALGPRGRVRGRCLPRRWRRRAARTSTSSSWTSGLVKGSGLDLCRELRAAHPETPVVFYSGEAFDSDREEARGSKQSSRAQSGLVPARRYIDEDAMDDDLVQALCLRGADVRTALEAGTGRAARRRAPRPRIRSGARPLHLQRRRLHAPPRRVHVRRAGARPDHLWRPAALRRGRADASTAENHLPPQCRRATQRLRVPHRLAVEIDPAARVEDE